MTGVEGGRPLLDGHAPQRPPSAAFSEPRGDLEYGEFEEGLKEDEPDVRGGAFQGPGSRETFATPTFRSWESARENAAEVCLSDLERSDDESMHLPGRRSRREGPSRVRGGPPLPSVELERFQRTLQVLSLDLSRTWRGTFSWITGFVLIIVVPTLSYFWIEPKDNAPEHQLPFRLLVIAMQSSLAATAFFFLHSTARQHGLRGILLLDLASEETPEIQREYNRCLKRANSLLLRVFFPAFLLHLVQRIWLFLEVPLQLLPLDLPSAYKMVEIVIVAITTSVAWVFQTLTFLLVCVIFWKVCTLQQLKMTRYHELVRTGVEPSLCFWEYARIVSGLGIISRRYRRFLALTGGITLFGGLGSMYEMVLYRAGHLNFFNSGNVAVVNWVALMGAGLCLRSASKVAHLHRRIVRAAATMHAQHTYQSAPRLASLDLRFSEEPMGEVQVLCQRQEAWAQRAALVAYLSNTSAGISVYGFVLDRTLVHTTLGALLTTTWFILGRSLSGSLPAVTQALHAAMQRV